MPAPGAREKASRSAVGDHSIDEIWSSSAVTCRGQPPSAETVQTWGSPEREVTKASRSPSGENDGDPAEPTRAIASTVLLRSALESWGTAGADHATNDNETATCTNK